MKNSKLLQSIQKLSARERILFQDFVQSPYFNKHEDTIQVLECIQEDLQKHKIPSRQKIFQKLYPNKSYNEAKINVLMSYLMNLLSAFLGQQDLENNQSELRIAQLKAAQQRGLDKIVKAQYRKITQQLEQEQIRDSQYYHHLSRTQKSMDTYHIIKGDRQQSGLLQSAVDNFDRYYISERLRFGCDMLSRMNIINEAFDLGILHDLLKHINAQKEVYLSVPSISIYYSILMSLQDSEDEQHYRLLIDLLEKYSLQFSREEAQEMYDYAQNYCIRKINAGRSDYEQEIFKLYNLQIEKDLIKQNGQLSEWDYKNIITVGCRLKAFDWTRNFLEENKKHLVESSRDNAYNYNLASFYYAQKTYDQALQLLQNVNFRESYYHLGAKFIQTKIYFEQEEWSALYSLLDSFKIYILRNKSMATTQRKAPLNFIRLTQKLAKIREKTEIRNTKYTEEALQKLEKAISESSAIVNVDWLQLQMKKLKNEISM
jgi:hypothetical protein